MKSKIKKIFKIIFGSDDSIFFKMSCSTFIIAIIFAILGFLSYNNHDSAITFTIIAGFFFSIWISIAQGVNSAISFLYELFRLLIFFSFLLLALYVCLKYALDNTSVNVIFVYLSCLALFMCIYYFISKAITIINYFKKLFAKIKTKLYNTTDPSPNKLKALIENVTAFLVAIGGLTVAIKVITESIFQVMNYFK